MFQKQFTSNPGQVIPDVNAIARVMRKAPFSNYYFAFPHPIEVLLERLLKGKTSGEDNM